MSAPHRLSVTNFDLIREEKSHDVLDGIYAFVHRRSQRRPRADVRAQDEQDVRDSRRRKNRKGTDSRVIRHKRNERG